MSEIRIYRESGTNNFVYDRTFFGSYKDCLSSLREGNVSVIQVNQVDGMSRIRVQDWWGQKHCRLQELDDVFVRVSSSEYRQSLRDNWAYASLTHFDTDVELDGYQIFRMKKDAVYYSISPYGAIVGVINNAYWPSVVLSEKSALDYVIPHALEHGGTWLTCWDTKITNVWICQGFLIENTEPYNVGVYGVPSDELRDVWVIGGWDYNSEQYPGIVTMRYSK